MTDLHEQIKNDYLLAFDSERSPRDCKGDARRVVENIVNVIFNEKKQQESFEAINRNSAHHNDNLAQSLRRTNSKKIYRKDSLGEKLDFLIDHGPLEENDRHKFFDIKNNGNTQGTAHSTTGKGDDRTIDQTRAYLNFIVTRYLEIYKKDSYIIDPYPQFGKNNEKKTAPELLDDIPNPNPKKKYAIAYLIAFIIFMSGFSYITYNIFQSKNKKDEPIKFIEKSTEDQNPPTLIDTSSQTRSSFIPEKTVSNNLDNDCCIISKNKIISISKRIKISSPNNISISFLENSLTQLLDIRSNCQSKRCNDKTELLALDETLRNFAQKLVVENPKPEFESKTINTKLLKTYNLLSYICEEIKCSQQINESLQKLQKLYSE
jgi:hypothetical protein